MEFDYTVQNFKECTASHKMKYKKFDEERKNLDFGDEGYVEKQARAFVHYWLYSIEELPSTIENFYNLLDDNFSINISSRLGSITDREEAISWIDSLRRTHKCTYHKIEKFRAWATDDYDRENQKINVEMTIDFAAIGITGSKIGNTTTYRWLIETEVDDEYPKIREMELKTVESFGILK
ncbi:MAG: hypothetical protein ACRQFF_08325 [Sphaerochaeta sp.]